MEHTRLSPPFALTEALGFSDEGSACGWSDLLAASAGFNELVCASSASCKQSSVQLLASTVSITLVNTGFVGLLGLSGLGGDTDARTASVASDAGRAAAEALAQRRPST